MNWNSVPKHRRKTRNGHQHKLFKKKFNAARMFIPPFCEVVNVWNKLSTKTDFSLHFTRSLVIC